jgi:hypothetical protein
MYMYAALGTLFTLSFVVVRLLTVPFSLYTYYLTWDTWIINAPNPKPWAGAWCMLVEKVFVPLPILINIYWGRLVVAGYIKAILGKGGKAKADKAK